jgi:hypothetical protein
MEIKTGELIDAALDHAVAMALGRVRPDGGLYAGHQGRTFRPSTNWAEGGPIIERNLIQVSPRWNNAGSFSKGLYMTKTGFWSWVAYVLGNGNIDGSFEQVGPTLLVAGLRCYVASRLGDSVDIPADFPVNLRKPQLKEEAIIRLSGHSVFDMTRSGNDFTIQIDTRKGFGIFDIDSGKTGDLYFDGNKLANIDLVSSLPKKIIKTLRDMGFVVERRFCGRTTC